jgi:hypothetical protein
MVNKSRSLQGCQRSALQMIEGRSTPLKPLLILLPEVPFESCISTTKQTWAGEHPKVTMVFIWKLHIPEGATAHHQWSKKLMGILKWKIHLMNICRCLACLYYASCCIAVDLPALNATYCGHLQHTGKLNALNQYLAYTFNLGGCPEASIYLQQPQKLRKSWRWFWSYWDDSHLTPPR